jgi:hypothetical protein
MIEERRLDWIVFVRPRDEQPTSFPINGNVTHAGAFRLARGIAPNLHSSCFRIERSK